MPIIVKPLAELNSPVPTNSLLRRNDGFDPLIPFQMIPLNKSREMVVQTGDFKAEMNLIEPGISFMSNFRILRQTSPSTFPLPGPGVEVRRITLPERSVVQFTLRGRSVGMANLQGRDRPVGSPLLKPDFNLLISVKPLVTHRLAVCYLFDRINGDKGKRADFASMLDEAHKIFFDQANFAMQNIDGAAVNTSARTITLSGTVGKFHDLGSRPLVRRITSALDAKFPTLARDANIILLQSSVPIGLKAKDRTIGMGVGWRRTSDQKLFTFVFLGPQIAPQKATRGGGPTPDRVFRSTLFHEIGHCLGLRHHPAEIRELPPPFLNNDINPVFFQPNFHNLMFPTSLISADTINFAQVEKLHRLPGPLRIFDF